MPMNPRLLRPLASGFDPRSISGLALWLDAADGSSLYTTDAGPVTAVSAPTEISGCVGWWDASDAASITQSGGLVSQWNDKSGQGYHLTASGSARPTTGTRSIGGRNAIDFDGTDDVLALGAYSLNLAATRAATVCVVMASDQPSAVRRVLSLQRTGKNPNDTGLFLGRHTSPTGATEFAVGGGDSTTNDQVDRNLIQGFADNTSSASVYTASVSAAANYARVFAAGAMQSLATRYGTMPASDFLAFGTGNHTIDIGATRSSGNAVQGFWDGPVAEVVIFNTALSTTDRARVEAYLAAKWGISGVHRNTQDELTAVAAPTDISGCVGWWDASDAASITQSGGLVSQWNDKSGQGNHATASGTARPTATASGLNGLQVLTFDGADDSMQITGTARTNETWFVVGRANVVPGAVKTNNFLMDASNGFGLAAVTKGDGATGTIEIPLGGFVTGTTRASVSIPTNTPVGPSVLSAVRSSVSGGVLLQNGVSQATCTTSNSFAITRISGPTTASVNGYIAEVIVFNTALSTTDRARVEAYLAAKWGISGVHAQATATNDPVGYWRDKSGNNRHATQATGASRPTVGSQNSKRAVSYPASPQAWLTTSAPSLSLSQPFTALYALRANASGAATLADGATGGTRSILSHTNGGAAQAWAGTSFQTYGFVRASEGNVGVFRFNGSASSGGVNNRSLSVVAATPGANGLSASAVIGNFTNYSTSLNGSLAELLFYNGSLSDSQVARVMAYLASKWGVTLAPTVSNADAQDWINRVYINGGTVSSTTASAVNQFCVDIEAAGIRDRFYRLNLFCGTADASLIAVRTPLYRGPSLAGTQYGNTLDTNVNFAITDYAETGTGGGLKGDGSTKSLNTGVANNAIPATDSHLMAYESVMGTQVFGATVGASGNKTPNAAWFLGYPSPANTVRYGAMVQAAYAISSSTGPAMFLGSNDATTTRIYRNGTLTGSTSGSHTARTSDTDQVIVFGMSFTTSVINRTSARINAYSLGLGMTQQQQADFYTAMQAFQTALGRNV